MSNYVINATYYTGSIGYITLPDNKTWEDIEDWYIKWDVFHYKFKNAEVWEELELNSDSMDSTDWKRPINATITSYNPETGEEDYENVIAECE